MSDFVVVVKDRDGTYRELPANSIPEALAIQKQEMAKGAKEATIKRK